MPIKAHIIGNTVSLLPLASFWTGALFFGSSRGILLRNHAATPTASTAVHRSGPKAVAGQHEVLGTCVGHETYPTHVMGCWPTLAGRIDLACEMSSASRAYKYQ